MSPRRRSLNEVESGVYSPWDDLAARENVLFGVVDFDPELGDALLWPLEDGRQVIAIASRLIGPERRCALAHELVHLDRGGSGIGSGQPALWPPVIAREERRVDGIVADRLVPQGQLDVYVRQVLSLGEGVTAVDVAQQFNVTEAVAARALSRLAMEGYG